MDLWAWFAVDASGRRRLLSRRPGAFSSLRIPLVYDDEGVARGAEASVAAIAAGRGSVRLELVALSAGAVAATI